LNKDEFKTILKKDKDIIDKEIKTFFKKDNLLEEAVFYSIDGGKRIRPVLFLESLKMLSGDTSDKDIISFASSIEMIHAYSLIHDDMPCMDDDDYRRGKETVHKKFGEDIALLAGDFLLNTAFENILRLANKDKKFLKAGYYISKSSGKDGMIKGQFNDIYKPKSYKLDYILDVYKNKTGRLFMASIVSAAYVQDIDEKSLKKLENFALYLGLAFQIQDDLLDYDEKSDEINILKIFSKEDSKAYLKEINEKAKAEIADFKNNEFFIYLIDYLSNRTI
jgi:geranylgeranyl diphosphate synthase type II